MTAARILKLASIPPWEDRNSVLIYDYESKMDMAGGLNRASTLSISRLPFVLFSGRDKARQSTRSLLPSDVEVDCSFSPITPPPPLPMLRQTVQQTLAKPLRTPPLSTATPLESERQIPAPSPSESVVLARPSLPKPPQPLPMAASAVSIQAVSMGRPLPRVEPVTSSSSPRVRPLPQRPPTAKPIEDENLWAGPDDRLGRSNSEQGKGYYSEFDSNALRRNRHIRRAQKAPLNGPRPLPPLPGTNQTILMEPYELTLKRASSPTQPAPPRVLAALHRSKSVPTSTPLHRKPKLHLVIPKTQGANSDRHFPQQEPSSTMPASCEGDSSGSRPRKSQWHSLDYFPTIDYASAATPSALRRPPPPDGAKDNVTLLDWHLLEQALGIDGDVDVTPSASPIMVSFLPSPGAPPVPAIPDRFLADRE